AGNRKRASLDSASHPRTAALTQTDSPKLRIGARRATRFSPVLQGFSLRQGYGSIKRLGRPAQKQRLRRNSLGGRHRLMRRANRPQTIIQEFYDLLHARAATPLEKKGRSCPPAIFRRDDQILGKKFGVPRGEAA